MRDPQKAKLNCDKLQKDFDATFSSLSMARNVRQSLYYSFNPKRFLDIGNEACIRQHFNF